MARPKNKQIGTCPCPVRDCARVVPVYRYRERGESPVSVANRRFAGKLYVACQDHGRMGDGAALQEFILDNSIIEGAGADRPAPAKTPEKIESAPATVPAKGPAKAPAPVNREEPAWAGWGWPWE